MIKSIYTALFFTASIFTSAQVGTDTSGRIGGEGSRITYGGSVNLGVSGGSGGAGISLGISPRVGYLLTNNLEAGLAGSINWGNNSYFSTTMAGIGPFANYYVSRSFFLNALYQHYFFSQKDKYYDLKYSNNEAALYLGGGYLQRIGNSTYMQIGAMYNVLYKSNRSVFGTGFVPNIGLVVGL